MLMLICCSGLIQDLCSGLPYNEEQIHKFDK